MPTPEPLADVGTWDTEDTYHPRSGQPVVERGRRTCAFVMQNSYLQCETVVSPPKGTGRTYRFVINYNATLRRFEMLSLWSNVPHKLVQQLAPDDSGARWQVTTIAVISEEMSPHSSEIVFESRQRIVWTGRHVTTGAPPEAWPTSFRGTWTRVQ